MVVVEIECIVSHLNTQESLDVLEWILDLLVLHFILFREVLLVFGFFEFVFW